MADPFSRPDLVTANLLATLAGITMKAGFNQTVSQVAFYTSFGLDPDSGQTLYIDNGLALFEGPMDSADESPLQRHDWWLMYGVQSYIYESSDGIFRARKRLQVFRGDIHKALMADITRGGNAHDTQVTGWQYIVDDSQPYAAQLDVKIRIRETYNDPTIPA